MLINLRVILILSLIENVIIRKCIYNYAIIAVLSVKNSIMIVFFCVIVYHYLCENGITQCYPQSLVVIFFLSYLLVRKSCVIEHSESLIFIKFLIIFC